MNRSVFCFSFNISVVKAIAIILFFYSFPLLAQKVNVKLSKEQQVYDDLQEAVLKNAITIGDTNIAIVALNNLLLLNPSDTTIKKQLLRIYFNLGKYYTSFNLAQKFLNEEKDSLFYLEVCGKSAEYLSYNEEALKYYEKLFNATGNTYYGYLKAYMQYQLFRYYECAQWISILLINPDIDKQSVLINYSENKSQQVPLRAALLNLDGLALSEMKEFTGALNSLEEALKVLPEYELAKNNLVLIKSFQEKEKK